MGVFNAHRAELRPYGLEGHPQGHDHLMEAYEQKQWHLKRVLQGFIRTTEVTRGKDGDMRASPLSRPIVG